MSLEAADYKSLTGWRYSNAALKSQKINNMKGRRLIFAPNVKEGKTMKKKIHDSKVRSPEEIDDTIIS